MTGLGLTVLAEPASRRVYPQHRTISPIWAALPLTPDVDRKGSGRRIMTHISRPSVDDTVRPLCAEMRVVLEPFMMRIDSKRSRLS
jgi:hypothetical protein